MKRVWGTLCSFTVTPRLVRDRKSTRLNSSHSQISYAVFCLKKKTVQGEAEAEPHGISLTDKDGFPALVLKIGNSSTRWNFACRPKCCDGIESLTYCVSAMQH